jgi:hypothetical protein
VAQPFPDFAGREFEKVQIDRLLHIRELADKKNNADVRLDTSS